MISDLWEVRGPGWLLPVEATWLGESDIADVRPAVPLLTPQREALNAVMVAAGHEVEGAWRCHRLALLSIARRSVETDPEKLVEWRPSKSIGLQEEDEDRRYVGHEALLELLVGHGLFSDLESADKAYRMICKAILHRLTVDRMPVHLAFIQLWPIPLRTNWKEITLAGDIKRKRTIHEDDPYLPSWLLTGDIEKRVGNDITDPKLVAVDSKNGLLEWALEVRYLTPWRQTINEAEKAREALGNNYDLYIKKLIQHYKPQALLHYAQYLRQIALPHVGWDWNRGAKLHPFITEARQRFSIALSAAEVRDSPSTFSVPAEFQGVRDGRDLPSTNDEMFGVSDFPQSPENVREEGADVDKPQLQS